MAGERLKNSEIDRIIDGVGFLLSGGENSVDYNDEENAVAQESDNGSYEDQEDVEMVVKVDVAFDLAIVGLVDPQHDCFRDRFSSANLGRPNAHGGGIPCAL